MGARDLRNCTVKIPGRAKIYQERNTFYVNSKYYYWNVILCENVEIQIDNNNFIIHGDEVVMKHFEHAMERDHKGAFPISIEDGEIKEFTVRKYVFFGPKITKYRIPGGRVCTKDRRPRTWEGHGCSLIIDGDVDVVRNGRECTD